MNESATEFWIRVNALIKSRKTKQQSVAEVCGISYQTFRGWVTRQSFPDALQVFRIAKSLDTTVEYLMTGSDTSPLAAENATLKDKISRAIEMLSETKSAGKSE